MALGILKSNLTFHLLFMYLSISISSVTIVMLLYNFSITCFQFEFGISIAQSYKLSCKENATCLNFDTCDGLVTAMWLHSNRSNWLTDSN